MKLISQLFCNYLIKVLMQIVVCAFITFPIQTIAQSEIFIRIGTEQGLAPGNVNDIVQDSNGFIWLGTESGLCRFDGYEFKTYTNNFADSNSLSYNNIFSLLMDKDGIIWVGTLGGGLNKFDSKTGKFIRYTNNINDPKSISNDIVFKVYKDSNSKIWVTTLGGGLNLFNPITEEFMNYSFDKTNNSSISSNITSAIYEDSKKNLWIGTFDGGLNLYNSTESTFTHFKNDVEDKSTINHNQVMDIIELSKDSLLVATFGGGINVFNTKTLKFSHRENRKEFEFQTEHRNIRKLYDDGNNIWIGSYNGLYQYTKKTKNITKYTFDQENPFSINNNKIREIFEDASGMIWIGTVYGVNQYDVDRKKFDFHPFTSEEEEILGETFYFPRSLNNQAILWPSGNKSDVKQRKLIKYYGNSNVLGEFKSKYSVNFYKDENNTLWIGDYDGLKYYDRKGKEFKYIEFFNDEKSVLSNNFIKSFYFDSDGDFWAGTLGGGLTHYSKLNKKITRYVHDEGDENSISDSRVIPIFEDDFGELWIGTYGGLNKFDRKNEIFKRYKYTPNDVKSISNDRIYSIYQSKLGDLWIGTYQGLNKYNRAKDSFEHVTVNDGLADNTVYGILEDDENNLWIRTNKGISKYDPIRKIIRNYFQIDGLEGLESNSSIYIKNNNGKMYFSGLNGYNSFFPEEIKDNTIAPKIVFTKLKILDEVIEVGDENYLPKSLNEIEELVLSYKDKVFSVEFSALHFAIPTKNKYAYMLEGFIDRWTFNDANHRVASFTNLSAGEYTLHVIASNNDGVWNETGRSLKIIITPPYWETWWFRLVAFVALLIIIFLVYEVRLTRLVEIERTRARIARNLHDDVGGTLASIQYFVDAIRKNRTEDHMNKFLDLIMASSNDAQEKIRDIIWTVNPKEDGLTRFLVKFNRHASDLLDSHNIKYKMNFPKLEVERKIGMEKRQHIWCICKETITNIIRHSNCSNVNVIFSLDGNKLHYSIEDDGVGFNKLTTLPGDGLTNIAFRSEKLGATYQIATEDQKGLKFEICFEI